MAKRGREVQDYTETKIYCKVGTMPGEVGFARFEKGKRPNKIVVGTMFRYRPYDVSRYTAECNLEMVIVREICHYPGNQFLPLMKLDKI